MSSQRSDILRFERPEPCGLRQTILAVLAEQAESIEAKKLHVELDIERSARFAECRLGLAETLERLVALAVNRSPFGSTLMITMLITRRGVEIEVADEGPQQALQARPFIGFGSRLLEHIPDSAGEPATAEDSRFRLYCGRCPQGGLAWTVVVNRPEAKELYRVA